MTRQQLPTMIPHLLGNNDVEWLLPGRKRPFARTPLATSQLIVLIAEEGYTVASARDAIYYDSEAQEILGFYVLHGYGDIPLSTLVIADGRPVDTRVKEVLEHVSAERQKKEQNHG